MAQRITIRYRRLEESYWSVSGSNLQRLAIYSSATPIYVIDPTTLNGLGYTKASTVPDATFNTNFYHQYTSDVVLPNASHFLQSNWTSLGWNTGSYTSFASDMSGFIQKNFDGGAGTPTLNSSLMDIHCAVLFGTVNGSAYAVALIQHGDCAARASYTIAQWPTGADGDLTINNGQTVNIAPGSVKNYNNLTINAGGTLNITSGASWTYIGVAGNLTLNGQILAQNGNWFGSSGSTNNITGNAPDLTGALAGEALSFTITQQQGGGSWNGGGGYGAEDSGNGGGGQGGGYFCYNNTGGNNGATFNGSWIGGSPGSANSSQGGHGGVSLPGNTTGGAGATSVGGTGGAGSQSANFTPSCVQQVPSLGTQIWNGSGGGGGFRGQHGQGVYLKVLGTATGTGTINASGTAGGTGGAGGPGYWYAQAGSGCSSDFATIGLAGAAGGGGAGGNGGKIVIRYNGTFPAGITKNVSGGTGGSGGNQHYSGGSSGATSCSNNFGPSGNNGNDGTVDIAGF